MSKNTRYSLRVAPLIAIDMLLAAGCFFAAYAYRIGVPVGGLTEMIEGLRQERWFQPYISIIIAAPFVRAFAYNMFNVYDDTNAYRSPLTNLLNISKAVTFGSVALVMVAFMYGSVSAFPEFGYSRKVFAIDWLLSLVCVAGVHSTVGLVRAEMLRRGLGFRRVAIQGAGLKADSLLTELANYPDYRYRVAGYIANDVPEDAPVRSSGSFQHLGATKDILDIINQHKLDEVLITNAGSLGTDLVAFVEECHKRDVVVKVSLDFYGILAHGRTLEEMAGQPVIQVNEIAIEGLARILKRIEDVVGSIFLLMMTFPLWLMLTYLIKRESPGPVLFHQRRVGKNGRTFTMYKFRSMYYDAEERKDELSELNEADGYIFKMKDDPRVTRIGKFIRRSCLDEIPQFLNVLKGEMSIVGPRPPVPEEAEKYTERHMERLMTTPGITGLWQVNRGHRYSFEEVLSWDAYYIENWSLWLDIKIMIKTIWVIFTGRGE